MRRPLAYGHVGSWQIVLQKSFGRRNVQDSFVRGGTADKKTQKSARTRSNIAVLIDLIDFCNTISTSATCRLASTTRGKSCVRESRKHGSVRGRSVMGVPTAILHQLSLAWFG